MRVIRLKFSVIFLVCIMLIMSACGSLPAATKPEDTQAKPKINETAANSSPFTYDGTDREQKLIEGAKKEGRLTWYTSLAGDVVNDLVQGFKGKYPFIQVEVFRGDQANVVQRITQEMQAKKNIADVIEVTADGALLLKEMGLLTPYYSSAAQNLPEAFITKADGKTIWRASDRVSYISFSYNKQKLPAAAIPRTLNDLLKPEMKGKLTIVSSTTGVRWVGAVLNSLGEQEGRKFLSELSKQDVKVQSISGAALMELIGQGEVASSMSIFQNHNDQQKAKGAPVEWIPIAPVVANAGDVVVPKQTVNPNGAMLLVDFLLGPDGAKIFQKNQYTSPSDKVAFQYWLPEESVSSSKQYEQEYNKWKELFGNSFR